MNDRMQRNAVALTGHDPDDPRKYVHIGAWLREEITAQRLKPGDLTPTVGALAVRFGCARKTAAKGLGILISEGLVRRCPGMGHYVTAPLPPQS